MNFYWLHEPWLETLGWTLLHSLWELSAIAAIAFVALLVLRHHAAHVRYAVAYVLLLAMIVVPVGTYGFLWTRRPQPVFVPAVAPGVLFNVPQASGGVHAPLVDAPASVTARERALSLLRALPPYAAVIYLAGAALLTLRLLAGYAALRRLRVHGQPAAGHRDLLEQLRHRLRITARVQLLLSARVEVPTVIGAWRPLILLPLTTASGLSTEHVTCLLLHELAHIRRHDFLANLVQSLVETLLFYHPAVAWLSGVVRQEREHCCDDIAAAATGNRAQYAAALVSMESLRPAIATLAMSANGGSLLARIQRLLRPAAPRSLSQRIISGSSLFAAALFVAAFACYLAACSRNDAPQPASAPAADSETRLMASAATTTAPSPNRPAQMGDVLSISIFELFAPGTNYTDNFPVDENGNVHVPYMGDVPVVGKTPRQISDAIARIATDKSLLRNAEVRVFHTNEIADLRPLQNGDRVMIKIFELEAPGSMADDTAVVDENGEVTVLHLGRVHVAGLTPTKASANIASTLVEKSILRAPAYTQVLRFYRNWPQISVESRIMFVNDSVLSSFALPPEGQTKTVVLSATELSRLLQGSQHDLTSVSVAAPRVIVFDGQTGTISITRAQPASPTGDDSNSGLQMKMIAVVSPDHRSVALTLDTTLHADALEKVTPPPPPQSLTSSISVPDGGTALQIGQSIESSAEGKPVKKRFIVLVRPKIIIQSEGEQNLFGTGYDRPTGLPTNPAGGAMQKGNGTDPASRVEHH